jgi:hypothetical protein
MIDLVTVVFIEEIDYLRTQAESVSLYVPQVNNIYIVVNDDDSICNLIDTAWWQQHQNKVKVIPYSKWNYVTSVSGWDNQQLLKLLAASEAESKWCMALDAKTWFVQHLDYTKLFDSQGRPITGVDKPILAFQSSKEFVEQHYNISLSGILGPSGVPFMFHTDTVRNMIQEFDNFIDFFQTQVRAPHCVTEFYLYCAYILSNQGTYKQLYNNNSPYYHFCNVADFDVPQFDQHITHMQTDTRLLTASIHRRAYPLLTESQLKDWAAFLHSRHINTISNWRYKWHSNLTLQ